MIDQLRWVEDLKSAIAGVQARIVAFDHAHRQTQAEVGVPTSGQGEGVGAGRVGSAGVPVPGDHPRDRA
ncbi:hypothetical protein [Arthrobacter sp. TMN-50]